MCVCVCVCVCVCEKGDLTRNQYKNIKKYSENIFFMCDNMLTYIFLIPLFFSFFFFC